MFFSWEWSIIILFLETQEAAVRLSQLVIACAGWCAFTAAVLPTQDSTASADKTASPAKLASVGGVCTADIVPPGGDNFINVLDLLFVLASWGPCGEEVCTADIEPLGGDNTIDVLDLLVVLASWGSCGFCPDSHEPNDNCARSSSLPLIGSSDGGETLQRYGTIMREDMDLFTLNARETDNTCGCCDTFCTDEDFEIRVSLAVPLSASGPLLFQVNETCTSDLVGEVSVAPGLSETISIWVDGTCSINPDTYTRYILVTGADPSIISCDSYTLTYSFIPGCQP